MRTMIARGMVIGAVAAGFASGAAAQTPAAPCPCPPAAPAGPWTGSAGFGLALNRGNTDTTNVNLTEGNSTTNVARVPVRLSAACRLPVSVHYATSNGTATAGLD